jgi:hypothetical protein
MELLIIILIVGALLTYWIWRERQLEESGHPLEYTKSLADSEGTADRAKQELRDAGEDIKTQTKKARGRKAASQ